MKQLAGSKHCFVCGTENEVGLKLKLMGEGDGKVFAKIIIPRQYAGWPGIVHGGILAAILDEAAGRTVDNDPIPKHLYVTGSLNLRYRHPVHCDTPLIVEAQFVRRNGRVVTSKGWIMDESRQILTEADAVYVEVDADFGRDNNDLEDEWVIFQDEEGSNDQ